MNNNKVFHKFLTCIAVSMTAMLFLSMHDKDPDQSKLNIQFENFVGQFQLKLDSAIYKNEIGQTYIISKFRYYISNITLIRANGSAYRSETSFLVDEFEPESKRIILNGIPAGEYTSMQFIVGVDSLHNCSGAQSGSLDPVNGMFWTWNTGYIFLKIEGKSAASKSPGNLIEFHIGGYRNPNNCIRNISLTFGNHPIDIKQGLNSEIKIKTDIAEIFKNPRTIDFSEISSVTDFHNAVLVADNYTDVFSLIE